MFKKIFLAISILFTSFWANAQSFPGLTEGKDYIKIPFNENVVENKSNKPVVLEFFWFGCGHCFKIKPLSKQLFESNKNISINLQYPAGFDGWTSGVKMFFTLKKMDLLDKMTDKVFNAIHVQGKNILKKDSDRDAFLKENGIDVEKFNSTYNSFSISTEVNKAKILTEKLKIESTPSYIVYKNGYAYQISPSLSKTYERTIEVTNIIVQSLK